MKLSIGLGVMSSRVEYKSNLGFEPKALVSAFNFTAMKASVEVSFYPLADEFIPRVWNFIAELKKSPEVEVQTNPLSTHLHGDLSLVLSVTTQAIENSFGSGNEGAVVLKVLPGDAREWED